MSEIIGTTAAVPTMAAAEVSPSRKGIGLAAWLAVVWLVIILVAVFFAPLLPLHDPNESFDGLKEVEVFVFRLLQDEIEKGFHDCDWATSAGRRGSSHD